MKLYKVIFSGSRGFLFSLTSLVLFACAERAWAAPVRYTLTDLGTLSGGGYPVSPADINNSGQIVGLAQDGTGRSRPFLYEAGVMRDLGAGTNNGFAMRINNAGQIIGHFGTPYDLITRGRDHMFLYSDGIVIDLSLHFGRFLALTGINDAGQISAWVEQDDGSIKPALIANGVLTYLEIPSLYTANDINNDGHILGTLMLPGETPGQPVFRAAIIEGTHVVDFGFPGSSSTHAVALNDQGQAVGYAWLPKGHARAFYYSRGRVVDAGTLRGDAASFLWDINNHGEAVGMSVLPEELGRAVIYEHGVLKNLNDMIPPESGWYLIFANGINDRGQIVGRAFVGEEVHGFLLTPIKRKEREN